jgi:L-lactate dehydrogenase complex protein LldG
MSRETILGAIRQGLGRKELSAHGKAEVADRLARHARNLVPDRGPDDQASRLERFARQMRETHATLAEVANERDVPAAIARYLAEGNLPSRVVLAPAVANLPWASQPLLETKVGASDGSDAVSVTGAFAGIAETGTLLLTSGEGSPQTLHLLPEHHVVVLKREQVLGSMEDCWQRLRAAGGMPRTAMFVSGPSSTADIELTLYLGAHGPRRLHVILVG